MTKRRTFIKNAALGGVSLEAANGIRSFLSENKLPGRGTLRDHLWLWGQTAGSHHGTANPYHLPGINNMGPKEGCEFLGIEKCCRVAMGKYGPFPPFDNEAEKLKGLKEIVWSALGDFSSKQHNNKESDIGAVLHIAGIYPNITGAILDDFFHRTEPGGILGRLSVESIQSIRHQLHQFNKRPMDLWVVWYTHQLDWDVTDYLRLFDVITFWEWKGSNLWNIDKNIEQFIKKTPGKQRFAGCYMWNYGEAKPLEMDLMRYQLDRFYHWIQKGDIEGIIFCSNCIEDVGLETVHYTRQGIEEMGDKKIYQT